MTDRFPIAVLVSGAGTNLQAIIDASQSDDFGAEVVVVVSDRPGAGALERAAVAGIATGIVDWAEYPDREKFTEAVCDIAAKHGAGALVLAGFMRILSRVAMQRFPDRIVNIHPALLPAFPGVHAVPQALAHGVKVTGVTVHLVDEKVDHGPIIYQRAVRIADDDTADTLHAKIQRIEHDVYPMVVDALARGLLTIDGRSVRWGES